MKKDRGNSQNNVYRPAGALAVKMGELLGFSAAASYQQSNRQPAKYPSTRIDNVLGDFSEQTGANFG